MITLTLGGEGYLNFMGNEFGHPGEAQDLLMRPKATHACCCAISLPL